MSTVRPIRKILIANRGEIAVRVIRTCRELGIASVAVFSEPDRTALHVRMADEAYPVGAAPSTESYLNQDRILNVADTAGADAVHPGYGFLAENAEFAEACERRELTFIGPPAEAIRAMGDKTAARTMMEEAGIPMAPGTLDAVADVDRAIELARGIGYPILIKAAAGGGGKGMRIVRDEDALPSSFEAAGREAEGAFGDARVFIEKYIDEPRHIEFQILVDRHGNAVHLFERECSIQRRHQKVVEEAPSVVVSPELRETMGRSAVRAALSCGYVGAGTVEFLVDRELNFYFMEMNTRLQVEHAVTEWISGLDLVRAQIRIAEGRDLPWKQEDLSISGHSIECRIYAEDPRNNFLPGAGSLLRHSIPGGHGVRVDAGVEQGDEVSVHYDPMISKVTSWGIDRDEAIVRMDRALAEYEISGVPSTIAFCRFVLASEAFRSGRFSTHFVDNHFNGSADQDPDLDLEDAMARSAAEIWAGSRSVYRQAPAGKDQDGDNPTSPWRANRGSTSRRDRIRRR